MTWMTQLDNTPAMDFLLPSATAGASGSSGSGHSAGGTGSTTKPKSKSGSGTKGGTHAVAHVVAFRGVVRASVSTRTAKAWINRKSVLYVDRRAKLRFVSTKVTSVSIHGHTATLRGVGKARGRRIGFRIVLAAAKPATLHVWIGKYRLAGRVVSGTVTVR
jgi:hypothetical protein